MKKSKPYRAVRFNERALHGLLTVQEVGRIVTAYDLDYLTALRHAKAMKGAWVGSALRDAELRDSLDAEVLHLHLSCLEDMGVSVHKGPGLIRSKRAPLGARDVYFTEEGEPVAFFIGDDPTYRTAASQALLLLTGQARCLESVVHPRGSGVAHHSATYRERDDAHQKQLVKLLQSFFSRTASAHRTQELAWLEPKIAAGTTRRLRSERTLDLVESLDHAKKRRAEQDALVEDLEAAVLRAMRGASHAILRDGSELESVAVHRDAHYVGASDYHLLRHIKE